MSKTARLGLLAVLLIETALLAPVLYSSHLRFTYTQTLARWLAKAVPPDTVFIGDSVTAGGGAFNGVRDINLATNGLQTYQIAEALKQALALSPSHVVVMAGTNDAVEGPIDPQELAGLWRTICTEPKVVVTQVTPTSNDEFNSRISQINRIVDAQCKDRPVISLAALAGSDGRIQPRYTADGVHLSPAGYAIWRSALRRHGI